MLDSVYEASVKEALRKKEMQYVFVAEPATLKREVWLLVGEKDEAARNYCNRILQHPAVRAGIRGIGSARDAEDFLEELADRANDSMDSVKNRQHFLYVSSSLEAVFEPDFASYRDEFTELEYDLIYLSRKVQNPGKECRFMRRMIIKPRDVHSGQLLALDAAYASYGFSPQDLSFSKEYGWYRVQTRDFSALRDDIYVQIYSGLHAQLTGEGMDAIQDRFQELDRYYGGYIDSLLREERIFPMAWDLPLPGYAQFRGTLESRLSGIRRGAGPVDAGITVGEALLYLFGNEQGMGRTERLRRELADGVLELVCRRAVQANRQGFAEQLYHMFTMHDLCSPSGIANLAGLWKYRYEKQADETERQLILSMQQAYLVSSLTPEGLFEGLRSYFGFWEQYIGFRLWKEWWEEIAELAAKTAAQYSGEYQALTDIFAVAGSNIDRDHIEFSSRNQIRSVGEVLNCIYGAAGIRVFSFDDLRRLADREARQFIAAKGDISDTERRPRMCLFASDALLKEKTTFRNDLEWHLRPVPYVTKAMVYFTAVYAVPEESKKDDPV